MHRSLSRQLPGEGAWSFPELNLVLNVHVLLPEHVIGSPSANSDPTPKHMGLSPAVVRRPQRGLCKA